MLLQRRQYCRIGCRLSVYRPTGRTPPTNRGGLFEKGRRPVSRLSLARIFKELSRNRITFASRIRSVRREPIHLLRAEAECPLVNVANLNSSRRRCQIACRSTEATEVSYTAVSIYSLSSPRPLSSFLFLDMYVCHRSAGCIQWTESRTTEALSR